MHKTMKVAGLLILTILLHTAAIAGDRSVTMITDTCVACHGDQGNSVGPAIPNLAGMSPNYLIAAMLAYKYDDDEDKLEEVIESEPAFEDVEEFPRFSTIMGRIAKGYTIEEIKMIAEYFSSITPKFPTQDYDADLASAGQELHEVHCDKCHENEGRSAEDDTGILAGQWKPYFMYTMHDFINGDRAMPKKMKKELDEIAETVGDDGIKQLAEYYASISD